MWKSVREAQSLRRASLPDGIRIYATGDIHGCTNLLRLQLAQIEADETRYPCVRSIIVFLGDYIDRGPDSRGTIDLLIAYAQMREVVFLKGNHETFIRRFLDAPGSLNDWRCLGGFETLVSYGLRPSLSRCHSNEDRLSEELQAVMPAEHFAFFDSLSSSFTCGDFFFTHAGVRPGIALDKQSEDDLLWIREDFLRHELPFEKFVVHGHTPVDAPDIRSNRANIDTGAFATGRLSCIAIEGSNLVPLSDIRDWRAGTDTRTVNITATAEHNDGREVSLWKRRNLHPPLPARTTGGEPS